MKQLSRVRNRETWTTHVWPAAKECILEEVSVEVELETFDVVHIFFHIRDESRACVKRGLYETTQKSCS